MALNCVANGKLLREGPFEDVWIQPGAGDAGGALGAALFVWHQLLNKPRPPRREDSQKGSLLGPRFSNDHIAHFLGETQAPHERFSNEEELLDEFARAMAAGKVVGWFHGRMEFGPRAVGARSIIGDARNTTMQATMNLKIKFRESFRPSAPCVLREKASEYFGLSAEHECPYMLLVAPVLEKHRVNLSEAEMKKMSESPDLRERVNIPRSTLPAITHVDYSTRLQTVDEARHGRFYRLMRAFERQTGCPVIVNMSFNIRGEPARRLAARRLPVIPGDGHGPAGAGGFRVAQGAHGNENHRGRTGEASRPIRAGLSHEVIRHQIQSDPACAAAICGGVAGVPAGVGRASAAGAQTSADGDCAGGAGRGPLGGLVVPATIRWIYVGCMIAAFPVGWVVSQVMLAVLFYVMITPVALLFRWRGRDSLHRAPAREGASYWTEKSQPEDLRRYFRQY